MPIKTEIMADRVATVDGHVYERKLSRNGSAVAIVPARRLTLHCRRSLNARNCAVTNCPHGLGVALQIWMVHADQKMDDDEYYDPPEKRMSHKQTWFGCARQSVCPSEFT